MRVTLPRRRSRLDQQQIRDYVSVISTRSVEETLNALLEAEHYPQPQQSGKRKREAIARFPFD